MNWECCKLQNDTLMFMHLSARVCTYMRWLIGASAHLEMGASGYVHTDEWFCGTMTIRPLGIEKDSIGQ